MKEFHWIQIAVYPSENFASMAAELLKQENIPVLLKKEGLGGAYQFSGMLAGNSYALLVPESCVDRAVNIVSIVGEDYLTR